MHRWSLQLGDPVEVTGAPAACCVVVLTRFQDGRWSKYRAGDVNDVAVYMKAVAVVRMA